MGGMFATNFTGLDWWIVAIYLVGTVLVGVVVNKYIHSVADYMVGGRGSGTALNAATFIGTGLGLVTIMYASIEGFSKGFSYMVLGLVGLTSGIVLGSTGFVVRRLREYALTTLPEYFERRYSRRVRVTAGIICALAGILNMGLFPKMGATFITYATGLGHADAAAVAEAPADAKAQPTTAAQPATAADTAKAAATTPAAKPPDTAAATRARQEFMVNVITSLLIALVLFYTVLGGMVSVIVTDYVQFVILSIGLGLGLYFCLTHPALGWDNMVNMMKVHRGEAAFNPVHPDSYGWLWVVWMFLHGGVGAVLWAPEASRMLTAKDPQTTKRTFLVASPGQFIRLAIPCLFAIAAFCYVSQSGGLARHFFPDGLSGDAENAAQAMPLLMGKIVPTGLLGLLVAGLMAAFMSTHDSYFLCWSSVITRDVVNPLRKRELTDKQQIRLTRIIIICIGLFLLVWGVWYELPASVWNYMAVTGSVYFCGAASVLIGGLYWKRASSAGAMAAMLGGLISVVVIFLPGKITGNTMLMGIIGLGNYLFCAIVFVVFSLLFPERPKPATQEA